MKALVTNDVRPIIMPQSSKLCDCEVSLQAGGPVYSNLQQGHRAASKTRSTVAAWSGDKHLQAKNT